ncbi:ASCH domain-containing protein [candidate division KSB1 bacterium]|nr:ASCH domain-containing protein [candidate division KSB1 bacterium]
MPDLLHTTSKLGIACVNGRDVLGESDKYIHLKRLIADHDDMYPGIDRWFDRKVKPGLQTGERIAFIGYDAAVPIVSSVVKIDGDSKFCHLHIDERYREMQLGEVFFSMMSLAVSRSATRVHFTLPEGLWSEQKEFFKSFGFATARNAHVNYRPGQDELLCTSNFQAVWQSVIAKIPKLIERFSTDESTSNGLLMSIKSDHANKILYGNKRVEIRKKFSREWIGRTIVIYSSDKQQKLAGQVRIANVVSGTPESVWERFNTEIGCSAAEYFSYAGNHHQVFALLLDSVVPYERSLTLTEARKYSSQRITPPQSYCRLTENKGWAEIVTLNEILAGQFTAKIDVG